MSIGDFLDYSGFGDINFFILPVLLCAFCSIYSVMGIISGKTTLPKAFLIVALVISIIMLIVFVICFNMTGGMDVMMIDNHWVAL